MDQEPIVFISYCHKDEEDKEELLSYLKVLSKRGLIQPWTDDDIDAGDRWKNAIEQALRNARIAILLVTNGFLGSDFILDEEVPALLKRLEQDNNLTVIPVIARPCYWQIHEWLKPLQVRPKNATPLRSLSENERAEALVELTKEIAGFIGRASGAQQAPEPKPSVHETRPASETLPPTQVQQPALAVSPEEAHGAGRKSAEGVNLITPQMLRYDATIPQCLDNQYISDEVYEYMIKNGADYTDPQVNEWRARDTNTEFIRSLVYSSQVVVNRVFLKNNKFLYSNFSEGSDNLDAFAELVKTQVIVPYLYKEKTLLDKTPTVDVRDEGEKAIRTLVEKVGEDVTCVRLAVADRENETQIELFESNFGTYFLGLPAYRPNQLKEMIDELFGLRQASPDTSAFRPHLLTLRDSVERCIDRDSILYRGALYKDLFIAGDEKEKGVNTALGRFRRPTEESPFLPELKKLVDLRYNSNLPDFLRRYTFTPVNMPSRLALQDGVRAVREIESKKVVNLIEELRTHFIQIQREFMAKAHKGMNLPFLGELSVADVIEARQLDEWHDFALYQQEILKEPLEILERLEIFQYKFEKFQHAMSNWYYKKYPARRRREQYANYVTLAIQAGGQLIALGVDPRFDNIRGRAKTHQPELLREMEIQDYDLLLMVNVIDLKQQKLDRDRSYSVEVVRNDAGLRGEKLYDLIKSFKDIGGDAVDYSAASDLAEQG
jgi:hypothetical protein